MITDEMRRLVAHQGLGFVATVNADGTPNLSPKGSTSVWDDRHLVFAHIRSDVTVDNLRSRPAVEVNVVDPIRRRGFRFKGRARVVDAGPEMDEVTAWYQADRGLDPATIKAVVLIEVSEAAPVLSPAYDRGETEDQLVEAWRRRLLPG